MFSKSVKTNEADCFGCAFARTVTVMTNMEVNEVHTIVSSYEMEVRDIRLSVGRIFSMMLSQNAIKLII
jgi:hypothetical protein